MFIDAGQHDIVFAPLGAKSRQLRTSQRTVGYNKSLYGVKSDIQEREVNALR